MIDDLYIDIGLSGPGSAAPPRPPPDWCPRPPICLSVSQPGDDATPTVAM